MVVSGERLSVRSVRGTRLTRPKHARPDGSRNSYAKHELLDAADSGRARRSRQQDPSDRRRVIPRRHVPAPVQDRTPATVSGTTRRPRHEPIIRAPRQRHRHRNLRQPRKPPRPHPPVRGLEPRSVRVRPHEPQRVLVRHPLRMRHRPEQRPTAPPRAPQHPREHRRRTPARRAAPRIASAPAAQTTARPARSPSPTVPIPPSAISSATQPPSEIPATSNSSGNCSRSAARARDGVTDSPGNGGAAPKPGMSTATTSSPNKGSTGSQTRWSAPSGCSRTSVKNARGSRPSAPRTRPRPRRSCGAAPPGRPPRPIAVATTSLSRRRSTPPASGFTGASFKTAAMASTCSPISRAPSPRRATRDASSSGPSQDLVILSGRDEQRRAVGDAEPENPQSSALHTATSDMTAGVAHASAVARCPRQRGLPSTICTLPIRRSVKPASQKRQVQPPEPEEALVVARARGSAPRTRPRSRASGAASRRSAG